MKANKFFRVLSGLLALILAIALLGITVLTVLPRFNIDFLDIEHELLTTLNLGISAATEELAEMLEFLTSLEGFAEIAFIGAAFTLPALLLIIAAAILFSRQKRGKGKFVFAVILAILGLAIFTAATEYFAECLFPEDLILYCRIGIGAFAAVMILFLVLSVVGKKSPHVQLVGVNLEDESEAGADAALEGQAFANAADQSEPSLDAQAAPAQSIAADAQSWDQQFIAATGAQAEYVPDDAKRTTDDVLEYTYQQTDNLSEASVRKIHTVRSLLNAHAISQDEYTKLVDRYLKEGNSAK